MSVRGWAPVIVLGWACSTGGDRSDARSLEVDRAGRVNPELEAKAEPRPDSNGGAESNPDPGAKVDASLASTGSPDGSSTARAAPNDGPGGSSDTGAGSSDGRGEAVLAEPEAVELRAADGVVVHGVLYAAGADRRLPIVLLFHQAGSNAAEYEPIAPRLQAAGHHALAIDQRSGKRRFGRDNLTVKAKGESTAFGPAYRDLEAALAWAQQRGHERVIAWGSSYSAALVFRLAAEHPDALAAVLAFSPGEYMGGKGTVAGWAGTVTVPVFVTSAPKEAETARAIAQAVGARAEQHVPARGVHGSSILRPDRNPSGHEAVWAAVDAFLSRVAG